MLSKQEKKGCKVLIVVFLLIKVTNRNILVKSFTNF